MAKSIYIKNSFTFNGKCSRDYGLVVTKFPDPIRPKRKGEAHDVPNRSGRIVDEFDEYENYTQPYACKLIATDGRGPGYAARALADWLLTSKGYCRLEDDAEPDVYRLARFAGPLDIASINDDTAEVTLEFDCQPKRYFKSGEESITFGHDKDSNSDILYVAIKENWKDIADFSGIIVYGHLKSGATVPSPIGSFWRNGKKSFDFDISSHVGDYFEAFFTYRGGAGEVRVDIPRDTIDFIEVYYSEDIDNFQFINNFVGNHNRMPNTQKAGSYSYGDFLVRNPSNYASAPVWRITTSGATASGITENGSARIITVTGNQTIVIDAETYDIRYSTGGNAASHVNFPRGQYQEIPKIDAGYTNFGLFTDGSITVQLTPRWWTL